MHFANGDIANKIGTYSHIVSAKHHNVGVMVVAPTSTIDMKIDSGAKIPIEDRPTKEVTHFYGTDMSTNFTEILNPAFDITPANLIDYIVTDKGIICGPDAKKMHTIFA